MDVPLRMVKRSVPRSREDNEILGTVVVLRAVDMVDMLPRFQRASEDILHDQSCSWDRMGALARDHDAPLVVDVEAVSPFVPVTASVTELGLGALHSITRRTHPWVRLFRSVAVHTALRRRHLPPAALRAGIDPGRIAVRRSPSTPRDGASMTWATQYLRYALWAAAGRAGILRMFPALRALPDVECAHGAATSGARPKLHGLTVAYR